MAAVAGGGAAVSTALVVSELPIAQAVPIDQGADIAAGATTGVEQIDDRNYDGEDEVRGPARIVFRASLTSDDVASLTLSLEQALALPSLWTPYLDELRIAAWRWARLGAIGRARTVKVGPCAQSLGLAAVMFLKGLFGDRANLIGESTRSVHSMRVNMQEPWQVELFCAFNDLKLKTKSYNGYKNMRITKQNGSVFVIATPLVIEFKKPRNMDYGFVYMHGAVWKLTRGSHDVILDLGSDLYWSSARYMAYVQATKVSLSEWAKVDRSWMHSLIVHYPTRPTISPEMREVLLEHARAAQVVVQRTDVHGKAVEAEDAGEAKSDDGEMVEV